MKILTATARTQGRRKDDFYWMTDGEPVYIGMRCDGARANDNCGCARAWTGLATHKAGTTAEVTETDRTREQYTDAYRLSLALAGWAIENPADTQAMADEMLGIAAQMPAGPVIEIRGRAIQVRRPAPAPARVRS